MHKGESLTSHQRLIAKSFPRLDVRRMSVDRGDLKALQVEKCSLGAESQAPGHP